MVNPAQDQNFSTPRDQNTQVFDGGAASAENTQQPGQEMPQQDPNPYTRPVPEQGARLQQPDYITEPQPEVNQPEQDYSPPAPSPAPQPEQPTSQPRPEESVAEQQFQPQNQEPSLTPPNQQAQNAYDPYMDRYADPYYYDEYAMGPQQEMLAYEWTAPSRPFKKHNRQYYTTVGTIVLLVALILFFAGQILPVAVVLAVGFMVYVMNSIPPTTIKNQITTYGIRTGDNLYYWDELGRFWFKKKYNDEILHVEVARFPDRLTMLIGKGEKQIIQEFMSSVLLEEEPPPTYYEKAAAWLQHKIPLDIEG